MNPQDNTVKVTVGHNVEGQVQTPSAPDELTDDEVIIIGTRVLMPDLDLDNADITADVVTEDDGSERKPFAWGCAIHPARLRQLILQPANITREEIGYLQLLGHCRSAYLRLAQGLWHPPVTELLAYADVRLRAVIGDDLDAISIANHLDHSQCDMCLGRYKICTAANFRLPDLLLKEDWVQDAMTRLSAADASVRAEIQSDVRERLKVCAVSQPVLAPQGWDTAAGAATESRLTFDDITLYLEQEDYLSALFAGQPRRPALQGTLYVNEQQELVIDLTAPTNLGRLHVSLHLEDGQLLCSAIVQMGRNDDERNRSGRLGKLDTFKASQGASYLATPIVIVVTHETTTKVDAMLDVWSQLWAVARRTPPTRKTSRKKKEPVPDLNQATVLSQCIPRDHFVTTWWQA